MKLDADEELLEPLPLAAQWCSATLLVLPWLWLCASTHRTHELSPLHQLRLSASQLRQPIGLC